MATKKDKENNGPSTQRTGTAGVNAIGVNHGMTRQEAVKPTPQQAMAQMSQTVIAQPAQVGPQQVPTQTAVNPQQNPVVQPTQPAPTTNSVQPVQQQQFTMPQQITMPNGQVINMQPQVQQVQPVQQPASVNIKGIGTVQAPNMQQPSTTPEQVKQAQANTQKQAQTDNDEYIKTLKEYLDSKYESPEDREAREKREARQRKWSAISEGIANVFNVGGSIAGARPAQWKSGVGDLYANQEAEGDKRRLEYRQALKDMIDYRTAIRNGDIAQARAIEERRKNDFYERKMLEDIASKQVNDELKKQKQEADIKRNDKLTEARIRDYDDKHEINEQKKNGTYQASKNVPKKSSGKRSSRSRSGRGSKTQKGRTSNGTQKQTAAAAASKNGVH